MKRLLFLCFIFLTMSNVLAQNDVAQIVANTNALRETLTGEYSVALMKNLHQSGVNALLLDAVVADQYDFVASMIHTDLKVIIRVKDKQDIDKVQNLVKRSFDVSRIFILTGDIQLCKAVQLQSRDCQIVYQGDDQNPKDLQKQGVRGVMYSSQALRLKPDLIKEVRATNLILMVNVADDVKGGMEMAKMGVEYVLTDEPVLLSASLADIHLLKVMSFNIRMSGMPKQDGVNAWEHRKEAVVRMVNDQRPDLLGVQEMLPDQKQYLQKELQQYKLIGVGRDDGKEEGECMGIFFNTNRFHLIGQKTLWLSETPDAVSKGWDAACMRTVTFVELKDVQTGREVCYLNTHLDHVGQLARLESINLLLKLVRELAPDDAVIVLGGDMNAEPGDPIFEPLMGSELKSARETAIQTDKVKSYNAFGKGTPSCIDQLYYLNTKALIFRTLTKNYEVPYLSDHYPVIGFFEL